MTLKVAILISGRGSNMEALIEATQADDFPARAVGVIANIEDAAGLKKAEALGVPAVAIPHKGKTKQQFEGEVQQALTDMHADVVCLAGFMRILSPDFVTRWQKRLLNIHPSLLPKYKGLHPQRRALEAGEAETGATVHYVSTAVDAGASIDMEKVKILPHDTETTLTDRIRQAEHRLYPRALRAVCEGLLGRRAG